MTRVYPFVTVSQARGPKRGRKCVPKRRKALQNNKSRLSLRESTCFRGAKADFGGNLLFCTALSLPFRNTFVDCTGGQRFLAGCPRLAGRGLEFRSRGFTVVV